MRRAITLGVVGALVLVAPIAARGATNSAASTVKITGSGYTAERDDPDAPIQVDAAAVLTNPTGRVAVDVYYEVRVTDTNGKLIEKRTSQHLNYVLPGQETYLAQDIDLFDAGSREVGDVKFRITEVGKLVAEGKWKDYEGKPEAGVPVANLLKFTDLHVQQTSFVFDVVHGLVTNTGTQLLSGSPFATDVSCALFRSGKIVGGAYDQISVLPPDTPVALMHDISPRMDPDDVRCSAQVASMVAVPVDSDASKLEVLDATMNSEGGTDDIDVAAKIRTNTTTIPEDVTADWEFQDAQGRVIGSAFESFNLGYLLPGQEATVDGGPESPQHLEGTPAKVVVRLAAGRFLTPRDFKARYGFAPGNQPFAVTDVKLTPAGSALVAISGTVTNSAKRSFDVLVHCGLYAGGRPVIVAVDIDVTVPGSGSAPFSDQFTAPVEITDSSCLAIAKSS